MIFKFIKLKLRICLVLVYKITNEQWYIIGVKIEWINHFSVSSTGKYIFILLKWW